MKLTAAMVSDVFEKVLDGRMTRDQADRWAYDLMLKDDDGLVEFSPIADHDRVWAGVMWLFGSDMRVAPGEFFHSEEDVRDAFSNFLTGRL